MFRKLFPWAMVLLIVVVIVAGCSKKPTEYKEQIPNDYAPSAIVAYPDTVKVTIKWARNSDAEAQAGFGGYYVYCTSRSLTYYQSTSDSIVGLTQLPAESLVYYEVPGSPFEKNTDSVVVIDDPLYKTKLKRGRKYYFYVRSMVDGQLSWASNRAVSSPLAQGDAKIFAYVPFDTLPGDSGLYAGLQLDRDTTKGIISPTLFKTPITIWRDTLIDSTDITVVIDSTDIIIDTLAMPHDTTYGTDTTWTIHTTITPADHDSVICGYMDVKDTVATRRVRFWKDGKPVVEIRKYKVLDMVKPVTKIDLIAKKISSTQVQLQSPQANTAIPIDGFWGTTGKNTLIQVLAGGWTTSVPDVFNITSTAITLNVGDVYQCYMSGGYYVKIRIDDIVAQGHNSIKVSFRYSYQMAAGIKSF
jgi:hypothetical protein